MDRIEPESRLEDENGLGKPFKLGEWLVLPSRNCLKSNKSEARIEPKVMQALVFLSSRQGEVVSREEMHTAIWGDIIVNDETLTRIISQLRVALQDDPRAVRFIETIYKRGYRLIAPITPVENEPEDIKPGNSQGLPADNVLFRTSVTRNGRLLRFGIPVFIIIACFATWLAIWRNQQDQELPVITTWQPIPVTSFVDDELFPMISPDGTRVAFSWNGGSGGPDQIWIKDLDSGEYTRITDTNKTTTRCAWSPDCATLAYCRNEADGSVEILLHPLESDESERLIHTTAQSVMGLDWSPDGSRLAISTSTVEHPFPLLYMLDVETGETSLFCQPQGPWCQDVMPAFSPDGRWLAFAHTDPAGAESIHVASLEDGETRQVTPHFLFIEGLDWLTDSTEVIFSATMPFELMLMRVDIGTGRITENPVQAKSIALPSVSQQGNRLVFEESNYNQEIWKLDLNAENGTASPAPLALTTETEAGADLSGDGAHLAYLSLRSGIPQIWLSSAEGDNQRQLTSFETGTLHHVRWSPDDRYLGVVHQEESGRSVCIVDAKSGAWRHIGDSRRNELFKSWSHDGEWLYYMTDRDGDLQLWRMSPNGSNAEKMLENNPSFFGESVNGRGLVYAPYGSDAIWERSLTDGEDRLLVDKTTAAGWSSRELTGNGIQYGLRRRGLCSVGYFDLETGRNEILAELPFGYILGLHLSADLSCIIFDTSKQYNSNISLIEKFN